MNSENVKKNVSFLKHDVNTHHAYELIKSGKSQEEAERIAKALNDRRKITGVHSHEFGGSKYKKEITPSEKEVTSNDDKQLELPFNESSLYEEVENKGYEGEEILTILGDMPDTVKDAYQNTIKLNVPSFSMISDTQSLRSKEDVKNYIRIFQPLKKKSHFFL